MLERIIDTFTIESEIKKRINKEPEIKSENIAEFKFIEDYGNFMGNTEKEFF